MKVQIGGNYRTRSGWRAHVDYITTGSWPFVGRIVMGSEGEVPCAWSGMGSANRGTPGFHDLEEGDPIDRGFLPGMTAVYRLRRNPGGPAR